MTPEQFWEDDPWLAQDYYDAHQLKIQQKSEEMWLQGLYNHTAVSIALSNAFRGNGTSPQRYPEEALRLIPYTEEEIQARKEREKQKLIEYLNGVQKKWDSAKCQSAKC